MAIGNISEDIEELEALIKCDKKKIKKLKKRLKGNIQKLEDLEDLLEQMLSRMEGDLKPYLKGTEWNPISECYEIILKGKMISFFDQELTSSEKPYKPYYLCDVEIFDPNDIKGKIKAYIWETTTIHHSRLIEPDAQICLVVQIVDEKNIYAKVIPPRIDITELVPKDELDKIREGTDYKPFTHEDKWWNRIPT